MDGGTEERRASRREARKRHHVVAAGAEGARRAARRPTRFRTPPLSRRRVLRRRQGQPLPAASVVRAAGRAVRAASRAHPEPGVGRGPEIARRVAVARRVRATRRRPRARDPPTRPARHPLRQPERQELPDDALRAPLARVHQPRRVRQDVHDHQPVQGLRLRAHRGRRRQVAAREGALGLRLRQACDSDRAAAGRSLPRGVCAAVHARRPRCRALRADLGGRPRCGGLRIDRVARGRPRARAARHGAAPGHLSSAPAFRRGRP